LGKPTDLVRVQDARSAAIHATMTAATTARISMCFIPCFDL